MRRIQEDKMYINDVNNLIVYDGDNEAYIRCLGHRYKECPGYEKCKQPMALRRSHRAICKDCKKGLSEFELDIRWDEF